MKRISTLLQFIIVCISISTAQGAPTLEDFNKLVAHDLTHETLLKKAYEESLMLLGCSDAQVPLHIAGCTINDEIIDPPTLVQYYSGFESGIYRASLFYLESATQSLRFAILDIYFQYEVQSDESESLSIIKVETNSPIH